MKFSFHKSFLLLIFFLFIKESQQSFFSVEIDQKSLLSCDELYSVIFTNLENITEYIDENIYFLKQKYPLCIDLLVKNGRLEALDYYLDELDKRKIEYRRSLSYSINTIKKQFEDVNIKYRYQKIEYKNMCPASQWAQSLDNIYIEIKFAHRHDSPGCLEVEDKKIDIKEDTLSFSGTCSLGDDYFKIDYHIKLLKKINVAASSHEAGAVGRYRFTLKKAERGFWERLLPEGEEPHSQMKIWYEMKEKYQDELMGYEKDEEDDKDDKDDKDDNDDDDDSKTKDNIKSSNETKKEEPKKEEPKKEEPKKGESKKEEPKIEETKKEEPKKEEPKKEEPKKEETKKVDPKKEEPKKKEPKKEEPKKEEPKKEEPKKVEPKKEEKKKEESKKEETKKEEPKKE